MPTPDGEDSKKSLVFTGERFIPRQTDPLLALEHYHRYYLASRFAQGKRILDIGCGEGYGSAFLSQTADTVIGIDLDPDAIDHARKHYSGIPNLSFEVGNCEEIPRISGNFDMVVGFELLEHLDSDHQPRLLSSVLQVLKPDGLFMVSSPEKNEYAEIHPAGNEFHRNEMTGPELKSFLSQYFKFVHLCGQRVLSLSAMWPMQSGESSQLKFYPRKDLLKEIPSGEPFSQPLYLIALCSNALSAHGADFESNSFYLDAGSSDPSKDFSKWALQLETTNSRLEKLLDERTAWAMRLDSEVQRNRELVRDLQNTMEERTAWATDLDSRIKAHGERIAILNAELEDRTKWALSLDSEISKIKKALYSSFIYRVLAKMKLLPRV